MKLPRNAQIWLPDYVYGEWRGQARPEPGRGRVWLSICDHYEPLWNGADDDAGRQRVGAWRARWPEIAGRHVDSSGRPPRYTFFFPQEEYRPDFLAPLAEMVYAGIADVEVHIHHDESTDPARGMGTFQERMETFLETLHGSHGLLRRDGAGRLRFGFIHGNWALDNSHPRGEWCGLNNEITLLRDLGCYADFTMPSGASPTQARTLNRIYWAVDDPAKPRSYDRGVTVEPGRPGAGDLLMIPGPFALRWRERLLPRMETGELSGYDLSSRYRWKRWLDVAPALGGDVFVKLFTHGCQERNSEPLLGGGLDDLFRHGAEECRRRGWQLRFATAWELAQAVECAAKGDPLG
jgi:hypothetical protein